MSATRRESFPLSPVQRGVWLDARRDATAGAYHISARLAARHPLDLGLLRAGGASIGSVHPQLTMSIDQRFAEPAQVIEPGMPIAVEFFPCTWPTAQAREKAIETHRREPFSLSEGPLFRVSLWDGPVQDLVLSWHHLAADAWSFRPLYEYLVSLHLGRKGRPPPGVTYRDFVRWYHERLASPEAETDLAYWRRELSGLKPLCVPPGAEERVSAGPAVLPVTVPPLAPAWQQSTLFEVFLSAFLVVLRAHTGQDDVSVVVPLLGRPRGGYLSVVGHFANVGVIRVDLSSTTVFADVLAAVRLKMRAALAHQFVPYPMLVDRLNLAAPGGGASVTDAYFGQIKLPPGLDLAGPGQPRPDSLLSLHSVEQSGSPWGLMLELVDGEAGQSAWLRCKPRLQGMAREIPAQIAAILEVAGRDPRARVGDLSWLSAQERARIEARRSLGPPLGPGPRERGRPASLPRTATEQALWEIWAEVLGSAELDVERGFFAMGGHSLRAAQVVARVSQRFGIRLPLAALFEKRSIRELAAFIDSQPVPLLPARVRPPQHPVLEGRYPLSYAQERMWFMNRLAPDSSAYNIHACLRLKREVHVSALEEAFRQVQVRHEILRTTFHEGEAGPVQVVATEPASRLQVVDLSGLPRAEREREARRTAEAGVLLPFDLESGPLVRLMLLRLSRDESVAVLSIHHIVADQWSLAILARELAALYSAAREGRKPGLPPLDLQYGPYARWQRETLTAEALGGHEQYWRSRLEGTGEVELPCDRPRPGVQTDRGRVVRHILEARELRAIRQLCDDQGVTPYMFFVSCFAVVLSRCTGCLDLAIGMPAANRSLPQAESLIGTFVNTLVLRVVVSLEQSFGELLAHVKDRVVEALEHQDYPFELLVQKLNPVRDPSRPPLVQVLVNMVDVRLDSMPGGAVGVEPVLLDATGVQFDLTLSIDVGYTQGLALHYNADLFEAASAARMLDHVGGVVRSVLADPAQSLGSIPVLSEVQRRTIIHDWNDTRRDFPLELALPAHLARSAAARRDCTALVFGDQRASYGELFGRVGLCSRAIQARGFGRGSVIAALLPRGPRALVSFLGIMESGAAYLPLDAAYPRARLQYMLEQSGAGALITERALDGRLGSDGAQVLLVEDIEREAHLDRRCDPPPAAGPDDLAYILYTSGSTGNPKGVAVAHRALVNLLFSMREQPGFDPDDRLLAVTPFSFDISGLELYLPLLCGATLILASQEATTDPMALKRLLEDEGISVMQATPATWRMLLEAGWRGRLRKILCGGEAFPADLVEPLLERCDELWNLYGPTETTVWSTAWRVTAPRSPVPIGRPIANTQVHILDRGLEPVPVGVRGDIYIGGAGLARGYHNLPELSAAAFVPHPWKRGERLYRTGDRGRYLSDGTIECLGRADSQVKLHGFRIELGEVEQALNLHPAVRQSVCIVADRGGGDARLVAYCAAADPAAGLPPAADLQRHLASLLPQYMVPAVYVAVERFPLTASGKIDRRALPHARAAVSNAQPQTAAERSVQRIWEEVLGCRNVGVEDSFFAVGGHSLSAVRVVARLRTELDAALTLRTFFLDPTIRGVARALEAGRVGTPPVARRHPQHLETDVLFPMQPEGSRRPLFVVAGIHAVEDGMYRYLASMVRNVGLDQPVYGLRPRALARPEPFYRSVREMAAAYVEEMRAAQPRGPYRLAGECVGGVVAYEMARQLEAAGERMECVLLLDTEYPRPLRSGLAAVRRTLLLKLRKLHVLAGLLIVDRGRARQEIRGFVARRKASLFPRTAEEQKAKRFVEVKTRYLRVVRRYAAAGYGGVVHVLVNESYHRCYPCLGWKLPSGAVARRGPAEVVVDLVPGNHMTRLTTFGRETGSVIRRILDTA